MDAYINVFTEQLEHKLPDLYNHLKELGIPKLNFLIEWAFTFYGRAFKLPMVAKIWDLFLAFGD